MTTARDDVLTKLTAQFASILANAAAKRARPSQADLDVCHSLALEAAGCAVPVQLVVTRCTAQINDVWAGLPKLKGQAGGGTPSPQEPNAEDTGDTRDAADAADAIRSASEAALSSVLAGHAGAFWAAAHQDVRQRNRFLDDLFGGGAPFPDLLEHGGRLGCQLGAPHVVITLVPDGPVDGWHELILRLEHSLRTRLATGGCLVGQYADGLVGLVPVASNDAARTLEAVCDTVVKVLKTQKARHPRWRIGVGRPRPGVHGIRGSYDEAREALEISKRAGTDSLDPYDAGLLLHRVLTRDRSAITDLVRAVLLPLSKAHQGPEPLLDTLDAYFTAGCMTTKAAQALHLSVRAVTYRLDRIRVLTAHDVGVPEQRFALETALRGARALGWPGQALPEC